MNVDKGNQSTGGADALVLGDIANGTSNCSGEAPYVIKPFDSAGLPFNKVTDAQGDLWIFTGTDSGFEGVTSLYYASIAVDLTHILVPGG